jgi:hypothetical protein
METIRIQTTSGLLIGKLIEDNIPEIIESQNNEIIEYNKKLGLASKVYIF